MSKYTFLIRPMESVQRFERYGEEIDASDVYVDFKLRSFCIGSSGSLDPVPEEFELPDALTGELELELPDDAAALAFVKSFDALALDPWRVDFVYREQEPPDPLVADAEIYAYGDTI